MLAGYLPKMRLLLTRPQEDARQLAESLSARGHEVVLEPLLQIRWHDDASLDLDGVQAVLLTSANGARALARRTARRDASVLAVGDATARAARAAGFADVVSADGDVDTLAALARRRHDPQAGALLHVCASAVAGDLAGALDAAGFEMRRAVLYEAEPARAFSPAGRAAIADAGLDGVLLFSPRTAAGFVRLIQAERLDNCCRRLTMFALSPAVAEAAAALPWGSRRIAAKPRQDALLALLDDQDGA